MLNSLLSLRLTASALALAILAGPAVAAGPSSPFQIGAWRAGGYTNDQTGAFSHCAAAVSYKSNITMLVVVSRAMAWSLGFAHPQWSLSKGDRIPIQLKFDGGAPYDETGVVLSSSPPLVEVPMPDNSKLINSFRHAALMTAVARGQNFAFSLKDTSQLLPALVNCVRTAVLAENNKSETPKPPSAAADANAIEEMQLATNFLLSARLANAHVISRAEAPATLASLGTTWKADNAAGAVKIYPAKAGQTGLQFASDLIYGDAQACQGKFASARSSELIDSDVVLRAVTSCEDSQGERALQYFITPWHKSSFAVFAVMGAPRAGSEAASEAQESAFTKAALGAARK